MAQTSKYYNVYAEVIANYVAPLQASEYFSVYSEVLANRVAGSHISVYGNVYSEVLGDYNALAKKLVLDALWVEVLHSQQAKVVGPTDMVAFHEVQFPANVAYGSQGGPTRKTEIITLDNGDEHRNSPWADSRRMWQVNYGVKSYDDLYDIIEFWEARQGPLHGFRFKDWLDYTSMGPQDTPTASDQNIGTGDGATTVFQLTKTYSSGGYNYIKTIVKPVSGTVLIYVNGSDPGGWTVDTTTGLVTFGSAPSVSDAITAGFEYDIPVRFQDDSITFSMDDFLAGSLPDINVVELKYNNLT